VWIGIVSLFPEMFQALTHYGITRRAIKKGILELETWNPRDFALDRHKTVDDKPYGGGPGMLMKMEPLNDAIQAARQKSSGDAPVVYLSPQGSKMMQSDFIRLSGLPELILLAGRYEGVDERLVQSVVDEEISIGDFVVSGGELPAMVLIDGVTRLLPNALGDDKSLESESFVDGLLDYPQYTRPKVVAGQPVPEVLLSGDHEMIRRWRKQKSLVRTFQRRPDLLLDRELSEEERNWLNAYKSKQRNREGTIDE